jgi:ABC-type multidrug transport system permease subunit
VGFSTGGGLIREAGKVGAFLRRDFLIAWSYRMSFVSDVAGLILMLTTFSFVGKLVDPAKLPSYDGRHATYMEFVVVGLAVGAFIQLGLHRVSVAIRNEQLLGTLESLLMTPTTSATLQLGSIVYDVVYIPVRTAIFIAVAAVVFGLDLELGGVAEATAVLVVFVPFVWGLGVAAAAGVLTFKRGAGVLGFGGTLLVLASGAYFPVGLLPGWLEATARVNPVAVAINAMREALIGGAGWAEIAPDLLYLVPMAILSLGFGVLAFSLALARERRNGTLGLY